VQRDGSAAAPDELHRLPDLEAPPGPAQQGAIAQHPAGTLPDHEHVGICLPGRVGSGGLGLVVDLLAEPRRRQTDMPEHCVGTQEGQVDAVVASQLRAATMLVPGARSVRAGPAPAGPRKRAGNQNAVRAVASGPVLIVLSCRMAKAGSGAVSPDPRPRGRRPDWDRRGPRSGWERRRLPRRLDATEGRMGAPVTWSEIDSTKSKALREF
jgi:hypothetical protein